MRCQSCQRFVPFADPEAELESSEISDDTVTGSIRVMLACGDCGTELKENTFDLEGEIEHECDPAKVDKDFDPDASEQFELESTPDVEATDRMEDKDWKGKTISNIRYMKRMIGAEMRATVRCNRCGEIFTVEASDEEQASGFNEL